MTEDPEKEAWVDPSKFYLDQEEAENIGRFIILWGGLEHTIDLLFPVVFRIDPTLATCITANLGTKAKVEILQSALAMIAPLLPAERVSETLDCLAMTLEMSGKYRNLLAHGRPIFGREEGNDPYWFWGRFAARKQLTMLVPETDADYWRMRACEVQIVIQGLFDETERLYALIEAISQDDWEKTCLIRHTKT